jgi:hypothetical protein
MNKIILIVLGILIFVIGGGMGILVQKQINSTLAENIGIISSKLISNISAWGIVDKVDGNKIILSGEEAGKNVIKVNNETIINRINFENGSTVMKKISINDIKPGDIADINMIMNNNTNSILFKPLCHIF